MISVILLPILFATMSWGQQLNLNGAEQCQIAGLPRSINDFGADLTRTLGGTDNIFISPLSIYTALSMTFLGAREQTAEQMDRAMKISANNLDQNQFHNSFKDILSTIKNSNDEYNLLLANGVFLQDGYKVNSNYTHDIQTYYSALMKLVDFVGNGQDAKRQINEFVAENTNDKIKDFLQQPLDASTVLALLNAVYFKGTWQIQFPEDSTRNGTFITSSGAPKQAKFMTLVNKKFFYFNDFRNNYKYLELPYRGGDISMILALPDDYQQAPNLDMTTEMFCRIKSSMQNTTVSTIQIPKFHLKYRKGLVETLQQLGILNLFANNADLTGMISTGDIKVSDVVHEAVIDVNEEGSEAAAATGVFITRMSIDFNNFYADHPFTFYIVDNRNGLILFSGRVADPS